MKAAVVSILKRLVMWAPIMTMLSEGLSWRANRTLPKAILDRSDPILFVISEGGQAVSSRWKIIVWRRIGLIAAEYFQAPGRSTEGGAKALLLAARKVPQAPRLQLAAAEFLARLKKSQLPEIFDGIAERFSENAEAQRARFRVMTRLQGRRAARDHVLMKPENESALGMMARAQGLEDLGEFEAADQVWTDALAKASETEKSKLTLALADSLVQRGWVGRALSMESNLPQAIRQQRRVDWAARLSRANASSDIGLYLPAHTAAQLFRQIEDQRKLLKPKNPKKIILINASLGRGGAERQCVNTAIGLAKSRPDLEIEVWVRNLDRGQSRNALLPELENAGVTVRGIDRFADVAGPLSRDWQGVSEALLKGSLPFLGPTVFRLYNGLRQHKPDVVHLWQDASIALMGLSVMWAKIPHIVLSLRSLPPPMKGADRPYYQPLISGIAKLPGVSLSANSHVGRETYSDWLGIAEDQISVIHNALSAKARRTDFTRSSGQRVIGVMRLDENKRPDVWIKVAESVLRRLPDSEFELIGDGPLAVEVAKRLAASDVGDRLILRGAVKRVRPFLEKADVLLHLARIEGLPNAVLEAQAAGCAVIATDAGGTREAFQPERTGILLENPDLLDVATIAKQVEILLSDADRLTHYKAEAIGFISERFHLDDMLKATLSIYGVK